MLYQSARLNGKITVEYKHDYKMFTVHLSDEIHFYLDMDEMKHFHYEIESSLYQAYQEEGADK